MAKQISIFNWEKRLLIISYANHEDLIFCWKPLYDEEPIVLEKELLSSFKEEYGKLPFANLVL